MPAAPAPSLLQKLDEYLNVDVDWMDPVFIDSMSIRPHDQTSNQAWVDSQMGDTSNTELLLQTAKELQGHNWTAIYSRMAVLMCKKNIDKIQGRVLLQTSPSLAYNTQATIDHARVYDAEFARVGITRDRYCIKIPATGEALNAAKVLTAEGIPTLGTAVFCLPQAIACSDAGMLYISPYYNEPQSESERAKLTPLSDPLFQHQMSGRIFQMIQAFLWRYRETGKEQPFVKLASFNSVEEILAAAEMGCHSATISYPLLNQLSTLHCDGFQELDAERLKPAHVYKCPAPMTERLKGLAPRLPPDVLDFDYLADGGKPLSRAIEGDRIARTWMTAALNLFIDAEKRSKAKVEEVVLMTQEVGCSL